jgi:purine catabolism regulator
MGDETVAAMVSKTREALNRELLDLVLQEKGLEALVASLERFVERPVLMLDGDFNPLASSNGEALFKAGEIKSGLLESSPSRTGRSRVVVAADGGEPLPLLLQPVRAGAELFGFLCLLEEKGTLCPPEEEAVEQAALLAALDFQKRRAVEEIERRYLNDFVRDLLEGRIETRASALHRGNIYKWDVTKPQVLFAIKLVTPSGYGVTHPSIAGKMQYLHRLEGRIRSVMLEHSKNDYLVAHMGDVNVMLLVPSAESPASVKQECLNIAERLVPRLQKGIDEQELIVKIGISRVCRDYSELPAAFREALEAIQMNVEMNSSGAVVHYDDLGMSRLLMRVEDVRELEKYCEEHLGELIRYDESCGTDLLKTLIAVIEADGNLRRASEKLYIHYNTLRYRLRRIKELAGIDFNCWQKVARVVVAIQVYRILRARKKIAQ